MPAPADAQGVSGTDRGMAAPGRFVVTPELGIVGIQFSRLNYGQQRAGDAGSAIVRDITNDRPREGGFASAIAAGWGLPGGLLGNPAEIYGRFGYVVASSSITSTEPSPAPGRYTIPLVAPAGAGSSSPGIGALLNVPADGTLNVTADRRIRSYDGGAGVRMNLRVGGVTVTPGIEFAYQRLDQDDDIAFVATTNYRTSARLQSDYYQFGLSLGMSYPLSTSVFLFGVLRGSLDIVDSSYDGQSVFFGTSVAFSQSTASDSRTFVSGRGSFRGGLAFMPSSNLTIGVSGLVEYIGAVPRVVYPVYNSADTTTPPLNGVTSAFIRHDGQLNFGGTVSATIRF
jgi:hypothetical protein